MLVEKAAPENTKKSTSYAVNVFDGKLLINISFNCQHNYNCCKISAQFLQVLQWLNSSRVKNVTNVIISLQKVTISSQFGVFTFFFSAWRKEKAISMPLHKFAKEELIKILQRFYVEARLIRQQILQL